MGNGRALPLPRTEAAFVGTRLFERPDFTAKDSPWRKLSWVRLTRARDAFFAALEDGKHPPALVGTGEETVPPDPIGYLVADGFELPLFAGATVVTRNDGRYATSAGAAGDSVVCVLLTSAAQASVCVQGRTETYHHGNRVTFDETSVELVLFSADLWAREGTHA